MKITSILQTIFAALILAASAVHAQSVYPPNTSISYFINNNLDKIFPYRGAYYDASKPGTGILLDMGSDGTTFLTYYNYTQTGAPLWYYLYGKYQPSDEVTRWTTGVIGTLAGNFTSVTGGQCLGCAYTPTTETPTNIGVNLVWVNSREVKMTIGSQSWDMVASPMDGKSDGDHLIGKWVMHSITTFSNLVFPANVNGSYSTQSYGSFTFDGMSVVSISPDPQGKGITVAQSSAPGLTAFHPGVNTYSIACAEQAGSGTCTKHMTLNPIGGIPGYFGSCLNQPAQLELWFDPQTGRIGADLVNSTTNVIGPANLHVDVYMQSPDLFIGRGIVEGTGLGIVQGGNYSLGSYCVDGAMNYELILQRLPDAAFGADSPYQG